MSWTGGWFSEMAGQISSFVLLDGCVYDIKRRVVLPTAKDIPVMNYSVHISTCGKR